MTLICTHLTLNYQSLTQPATMSGITLPSITALPLFSRTTPDYHTHPALHRNPSDPQDFRVRHYQASDG